MKNRLTLKELTESLVKICEKHPELLDSEVTVATECGYSGASIQNPLILYKIARSNELGFNSVHIMTTDDVGMNMENYLYWE